MTDRIKITHIGAMDDELMIIAYTLLDDHMEPPVERHDLHFIFNTFNELKPKTDPAVFCLKVCTNPEYGENWKQLIWDQKDGIPPGDEMITVYIDDDQDFMDTFCANFEVTPDDVLRACILLLQDARGQERLRQMAEEQNRIDIEETLVESLNNTYPLSQESEPLADNSSS